MESYKNKGLSSFMYSIDPQYYQKNSYRPNSPGTFSKVRESCPYEQKKSKVLE